MADLLIVAQLLSSSSAPDWLATRQTTTACDWLDCGERVDHPMQEGPDAGQSRRASHNPIPAVPTGSCLSLRRSLHSRPAIATTSHHLAPKSRPGQYRAQPDSRPHSLAIARTAAIHDVRRRQPRRSNAQDGESTRGHWLHPAVSPPPGLLRTKTQNSS